MRIAPYVGSLWYSNLLADVARRGNYTAPRGMETRELTGVQVRFVAGETVRRTGFNMALARTELRQMLSGHFDPNELREVAPNANHELFETACDYGPRLKDQYGPVLEEFRRDRESRRAVLVFDRPGDVGAGTLPCINSVQLLLRPGRTAPTPTLVDAHVSMRSWDLVLGLPYDIVLFGGLVQWIAHELQAWPGTVTVTVGSAHIYEKDLHAVAGPGMVFRYDVP